MMKKNKFIITILLLIGIVFLACEPMMMEKPDIGTAPNESQLSFTITQGADAFHFVITNTSSVTGIANWDLGNGVKTSGEEITATYSVEDTYTIKLTLVTKGGTASITQDFVQTETDYSIFSDPVYINLSGGTAAINGKTWVVDSTNAGHFGIGPATGDFPEWWAATPLQKTGGGAYDDEINLNINQFQITYLNHNDSYVKDYRISDPNYSNPVPVDGTDSRVTYPSPEAGSWTVSEKDGESFVVINSSKPIFWGMDYGAANNEYRIEELSENILKLSCIGGDGNRWYNILIPKGYEKPKLEYDLTVTGTGNTNEYSIGISNVVLPTGWSISNIVYSFGDATTSETTDDTQTFTKTYMRKGSYFVEVTVTANDETFTKSETVVVANNHPSYVEYLLDAMVMYNDFGETTIMTVAGENCSVDKVANPDKSKWPNRSNNCAKYTKTNQQWANAFMQLPAGYRFNLDLQSVFKILVYGTAGQTVLLKLENTDRGGNAWQTGAEITYTIQESNKWEVAEYNFAGVGAGWDWTGDIYTSDVTTDPNFNQGFYNVVRIMYQPGDDSQEYSFYFDDLAGPHVEGLK